MNACSSRPPWPNKYLVNVLLTELFDRFRDHLFPRHHVKRMLIPSFSLLIVDGLVQRQNRVVVARVGAVVDSFGTSAKVGSGAANNRTWIAPAAAHGNWIKDKIPTRRRRQDTAGVGDAGGQFRHAATWSRDRPRVR